jgi:3-oxoacyl-(acyl-carrier-protein) synthase
LGLNILAGRSGIAPWKAFDTTNFPTHFGGEIRKLDLEPYMSPRTRAAWTPSCNTAWWRAFRPCATPDCK